MATVDSQNYDADYGTAFYRTRDAINNIRIRVKLEKVSASTNVPQMIPDSLKDTNTDLRNLVQEPDAETYEFRWQEKVHSMREVEMYKDKQRCITVLDKKYHEDALLILECGFPTKRLFSYVDHDTFTNSDQMVRKFTTLSTDDQTLLAEKMETVRHRKGALCRSDKKPIPRTNLVIPEPSDEMQKTNRLVSATVHTMYIMADLAPSNRPSTAEDEEILCTIKIDGNGVLSIRPDFSKGRRPYKVDSVLSQGKELCQYTLENASKQLSRQEQEKEFKMYKEMYSRHADFLSSCIGEKFDELDLDVLRLVIHGVIDSARCFEYDNLYIDWFIDLPDGWLILNPRSMAGVTQTCATKIEGRDDVAYFSFPFSLDVRYRPSCHQEKTSGVILQWPRLFVEVLSLDSWQRYRAEGYGCLTLPNLPGSRTDEIMCWRPTGETCVSELRRFFIGGCPELEDPTYVSTPTTFEGSHLSKFGFRSIGTGSVCVKTNTILQSQSFLHNQTSRKKATSIIDKIGFSVTQTNITNVLDAFQRAKQRMVAARENLKKEYIETIRAYAIEESDA